MSSLSDPRRGGQCNIGPAEIARRRRLAIALTAATLGLAALLVVLAVPPLARMLLWPSAAAAGVTWLQVTRRFCVRFGAAGLENFGPLGSEHPVAAEQREADRRHAGQLVFEGILAGLLATVAFMNLPL